MSRTFFDQVLVTEPPRRGSGWMKAASIVVHLAIVLAIFVLPITAALELPGVYTSLPPIVLATVAPMPAPLPPRVATPVAATAPSIPLEAPDGITQDKETPPAAAFTTPGALPNVGGGPGGLVSLGHSTITIAQPPEQPQAPRRVGGDISPPERTTYKAPQYPQGAQSARMEGTVILEAIIDAQGLVQNVTVLKSVPLLDRAAIEAVQQWRYRPTRLNGTAIPIIMSVRVTFTLR